MKLKAGTEEAYAKYKAVNTDLYGSDIVSYGERWANLMEARMAKGEKIADIAKETSREADTTGIAGPILLCCAVMALIYFWQHGEELRLWYNIDTQIKDEGVRANESGGVLNPAMLPIGGVDPGSY
jgi:hypothetical protein